MGGFFASLKGLGGVFCSIFSYKLLMSSLIGKLFYFRPRFHSELPKEKKKKKGDKSSSDKEEKKRKKKLKVVYNKEIEKTDYLKVFKDSIKDQLLLDEEKKDTGPTNFADEFKKILR
jgi:hypothetical protein